MIYLKWKNTYLKHMVSLGADGAKGDKGDTGDNAVITGSASTIDTETIAASRALVTDGSGKVAVSDVTSSELAVLDGVTSTTAELNILDGVTSTAAELNILDGVTSTATEINLLDGGTSVGSSITVADADGIIINDNGTMKTIPASDFTSYVQSGTSLDELSDSKSEGTDFTGSIILGHQTTGTLDDATYNTAVGLAALDAITTGDHNVAVGYGTLGANTTGSRNTASG